MLRRNPSDDRAVLAAVGVSEQSDDWLSLLEVISADDLKFEYMSKAYLSAFTLALKHTHISQWPRQHIERVLVACLPRWGSMIPRDSLADLLTTVHVVVTHGLSLLNMPDKSSTSGVPQRAMDEIHSIRVDLLRILWYSSALATLFTVIKCTVGDNEDSIRNVLLHHNSDNESHRQTVVAAQEKALECLGSLFKLVSRTPHDPSLDQLASVLKQAGSDLNDSSALPLFVSVASFLVGGANLKVRPQTVDAAGGCLVGIVELCDLSPSLFQTNFRLKDLGDKIITAAIEGVESRSSKLCVDLINALVIHLPSVCVPSGKKLGDAVQSHQCLYRSVGILSQAPVTVVDSDEVFTSGKALALAKAGEKDKVEQFLEASLGDVEWLKSHILPTKDDVLCLSNFYSVLQSLRIHPGWVIESAAVSEQSLVHLARATRGIHLQSMNIVAVNAALAKLQSALSLLDSFDELLRTHLSANPSTATSLLTRVKLALFAVLAEADVDTVRECPKILSAILDILAHVFQHEIAQTGLPVSETPRPRDESEKRLAEILSNLLLTAVGFNRDTPHLTLIQKTVTLVPFLLPSGDEATDVILALIHSVSPSVALTATPAVLSTLESLIQSSAASLDSAVKKTVLTYLFGLMTEFSNTSSTAAAIDKSVLVVLLSLLASSLVVIGNKSSITPPISLWTVLACHPAVQAAAAAASWDSQLARYTVDHLVWIHALQVGVVLLSSGIVDEGKDKFFAIHGDVLTERFTTAHTSDLARLEEACLISRLFELSGYSGPAWPFQFTSLITPKQPSVYPKSRMEKIAGGLAANVDDEDVQSPCLLPSVFAQRVVWLAADILASSVRRIIQQADTHVLVDPQSLFHSLLDCSHFVIQYLAEASGGRHRAKVLRLIRIGEQGQYVPLSVYLSVDAGGVAAAKSAAAKKPVGGSLLNSMHSPPLAAAKPPQPTTTASLMDSLTPRNSPKGSSSPAEADPDVKFVSAQPGDCPSRTGLSFIVPSLVTEDDFVGRLVDVLSLCLIQAMRLATSEALIRPLLDLLLTTRSNGPDRLPSDANWIISEVIDKITPRYNELCSRQQSHHSRPQVAAIGGPLGYAAISNIR